MRTHILLVIVSLFLLAACSYTLTVTLPPQTIQVPALSDTQGKIVYKKDPVSFSPPPVAPKDVTLSGTLEASQTLNATLGFYVRLVDPASDPACYGIPFAQVAQAYVCPIGTNDEKAGEANFQNVKSTSLTLKGGNLTQGISEGRFWVGLEVQGLPSENVTFTLKDLKATVTVGF